MYKLLKFEDGTQGLFDDGQEVTTEGFLGTLFGVFVGLPIIMMMLFSILIDVEAKKYEKEKKKAEEKYNKEMAALSDDQKAALNKLANSFSSQVDKIKKFNEGLKKIFQRNFEPINKKFPKMIDIQYELSEKSIKSFETNVRRSVEDAYLHKKDITYEFYFPVIGVDWDYDTESYGRIIPVGAIDMLEVACDKSKKETQALFKSIYGNDELIKLDDWFRDMIDDSVFSPSIKGRLKLQ